MKQTTTKKFKFKITGLLIFVLFCFWAGVKIAKDTNLVTFLLYMSNVARLQLICLAASLAHSASSSTVSASQLTSTWTWLEKVY